MFKIFKKPGRTSSEKLQSGKSDSKRHSRSLSTNSCDDTNNLEELYDTNDDDPVFEYSSRLSMNINAIVNEKNCLIYFVQFLESKNALPLIKFYLDTENFKFSLEFDPKSKTNGLPSEDCYLCSISDDFPNSDTASLHSQQSVSEICKTSKNCSDTQKDTDASAGSGIKTLYDLTMTKSLTDDEKSQIYAEKNKNQLERSESTTSGSKHTCKTTDAICIYKKYFMPSSEYFVSLPVCILSEISLILCSDEKFCYTHAIPKNLFDSAQRYILDKLEHEHLYDFLQSDMYCKYCIELLRSSEMTLFDILYSESALFYFMEYLEQENQRNCLDFWIAAINFRKHYESKQLSSAATQNEAQSDAMILYEKYFSLQADAPLRISDRLRSIVEERICSNETTSKISRCFDRPLKYTENYLEKEFFPSFIESPLYSKYVHELRSKLSDHYRPDAVNNVNNNEVQTTITKHRKTMSDCTNKSTKDLTKHFISQHNTLLAMESCSSNSQRSTSSSNNSPDMQIDSRHFFNPDMLWQRHQTGGLKFGRVNALGRYERDFDICPVSKNWSLSVGSNTIKNVVRKLVNIPEQKIQEEIAWQIAEMIIDEVLSITMNRELTHKSV